MNDELDSLIQYLAEEKVRSQERLRRTILFLDQRFIKSSSATVRESLDILRQNAEADYDCILHLLTLLRNNQTQIREKLSKEEDSSPVVAQPPQQESKSSLNMPTHTEFEIVDPLSHVYDRNTQEPFDKDFCEEEDDNGTRDKVRFSEDAYNSKPSGITNMARSLPVNVPWPLKEHKKDYPSMEDDDIPEDLESGIAYIMSLKNDMFGLSSPKYAFKAD